MNFIEAYNKAQSLQRQNPDIDERELDELAQIVADSGGFVYSYLWAHDVGTHLELMSKVVLESGDFDFIAAWCIDIGEDRISHVEFKLRIIELGRIDEFVESMNADRKTRGKSSRGYSLEDFYSDLPQEAKLGVFL